MPEGQSFPERLRALRHRSSAALAPLWIEQLPPEEALAELRAREGELFRLQEARFLLNLGETEKAQGILRGLPHLRPGLAAIRDELLNRLGEAGQRAPAREAAVGHPSSLAPSSASPAPSVEQVHAPAAAAEDPLSGWLETVQGWRRALHV